MKAEAAQNMPENNKPCKVAEEGEAEDGAGKAGRGQDMKGLSCHTGEPAIRPESFT